MKSNHIEYKSLADYSSIFGSQMSDKKFVMMLSGIGCQKALIIVSRFSSLHIACCNNNPDAKRLHLQLRHTHAFHISEIGGNEILYEKFPAIICPQSLFILSKWVLAYCSTEKPLDEIGISDLMLMLDALLIINDKLGKDDVSNYKVEYLYLTLYHNTHKIVLNQLARAYYIYVLLSKQIAETREFIRQYEEKWFFDRG